MTQFVLAVVTASALVGVQGKPAKPTAAKSSAVGACALLTKAEVKKLTGSDDQFFDLVPPRQESLPGGGSACFYSGIVVQVDPFPPATLEANRKKSGAKWETVTGVGNVAYISDKRPGAGLHLAELYATVGTRVLTIQFSVRPSEASIDTVRPKMLALAKALVAKLPPSR